MLSGLLWLFCPVLRLENTDAIIFMLNASRLLTEGEKKLLTSIKEQIQGDNLDTPVENIVIPLGI